MIPDGPDPRRGRRSWIRNGKGRRGQRRGKREEGREKRRERREGEGRGGEGEKE